MRTDYIGLRVARWRDIGGMTQQQLGDAVGVTREYISMIENGKRPITKRSLLISLAQALDVSVVDLTGQPYEPQTAEDLAILHIEAGVRTALDEDLDDGPLPNSAELATTTERVRRARMALDYRTLAELLPDLVGKARALAASDNDSDARTGLSLFVVATVEAPSTPR
jgi:transcriptional regulator with XRE-family HTH domain